MPITTVTTMAKDLYYNLSILIFSSLILCDLIPILSVLVQGSPTSSLQPLLSHGTRTREQQADMCAHVCAAQLVQVKLRVHARAC